MTVLPPEPVELAVILTGAGATLWDVRTRRIPNALTLGSAAVALAFHAIEPGSAAQGLAALGWSAAGWLIGLMLFLPIFLLRGMGAGDLKLLAAFGAWLGPGTVGWVAIYGAIAGGVMAVPLLFARRAWATTIANLWGLFALWRLVGVRTHPGLTLDVPGTMRLPYALPLSVGAVVALWLKR